MCDFRWVIGILAITWICSLSAEEPEDVRTFGQSTVEINGTATGGAVTLGWTTNPNKKLTVTTISGETAQHVAAKLAAKADEIAAPYRTTEVLQLTPEMQNLWLIETKVANDGKSLSISNSTAGDIFFQSTDAGIQVVSPVTGLNAISNKQGDKVTLTWTAPATTVDRIFIYRNGELHKTLPGDSTSYEDTNIPGETEGVPWEFKYSLVCAKKTTGDGYVCFSDVVVISSNNPARMPDDTFKIVTPSDLLHSKIGAVYSHPVRKSGGKNPVVWSLANGNLPPGISLSADGRLAGTTTASGTFSFTLKVTDANNIEVQKDFSMDVVDR